MPRLRRFHHLVQNSSGTALSGISVTLYREGAHVNGAQSGTSPFTVTVRNANKITRDSGSPDLLFINATTGTTYSGYAASDTTVVLSGFAGTLALSANDRLVPSGTQPLLYDDDFGGGTAITQPLSTGADGAVTAFTEHAAADVLISGGSPAITAVLLAGYTIPSSSPAQLRYADEFSRGSTTLGIQEAINDLPVAGGTVIGPSTSGTITTAITVATKVTVIQHSAAPVITKGVNGAIFTLASKSVLRGLRLDGATSGGFTGVGVAITSADEAEVTGCEIVNCTGIGIDIDTSNKVLIERNRISACKGNGVYWENNSDDVICRDNWISSTTGSSAIHCIAAHGTTASQTANRPIIESNNLIIGVAASYGIEIGAFTGSSVLDAIVRGNTIKASATCAGGISFGDTCTGGVISGNTINVNSQTGTVAGIQLISCTGVAVTGNTIRGGTTLANGILATTSASNIISANMLTGWTGGATNYGISIASATTSGDASRNVITSNIVKLPVGGAGRAINIQANGTSVTAANNRVESNTIIGDSTAGQTAIAIRDTTGTANGNQVYNNLVLLCAIGVEVGTAVDELNIANNDLRGATTAVSGSSSGQVRQWDNVTANDQVILTRSGGVNVGTVLALDGRLTKMGGSENLAAAATISVTKNFVRLTTDTGDIATINIDGSAPTSAHDTYLLTMVNVTGGQVLLLNTGNIRVAATMNDQESFTLWWDNVLATPKWRVMANP